MVRLLVWIDWTQQHLASHLTPTPDAFNLGLKDGPAAGQTVPQLHFHVIPRYTAAMSPTPAAASATSSPPKPATGSRPPERHGRRILLLLHHP